MRICHRGVGSSSFLLAGVLFTALLGAESLRGANVDEISASLNSLVTNSTARAFSLCHLRAAVWGGYDVTVSVGKAATSDGQGRRFVIGQGVFAVVIDNTISDLASTPSVRAGRIYIPAKEAAFDMGVPFYISDVTLDGSTVNYTVHSNPTSSTSSWSCTSWYSPWAGGGYTEQSQCTTSYRASPQPQPLTMSLFGALSRGNRNDLSLKLTQSWGSCWVSNEIDLNSAQQIAPAITAAGIGNSASYAAAGVAPGEIVVVFGEHFGPSSVARFSLGSDRRVPSLLASTRLLFDDVAAPMIYAAKGQLSAVVPYAVEGKQSTSVSVEYAGVKSPAVSIPVVAAAPGIFTLDSSGKGPGAILNQDGTVNSRTAPASRGSVITIFATGEGQTDPPGQDGKPAAEPLPRPALPVSVEIGGVAAEVRYAGGAPGLVAGVIQINAQVPSTVAPGNTVPVVVKVGQASSQTGVTVAIN